jgi:phenylacetate-CoA ligase
VAATSGSSGRCSIIPTDAHEWAMVIAGYARANEWAGVRAGPRHRTRMAVVSSTTVWHQSSRVAASVRSPFVASARLDAAAPLGDTVERLNAIAPEVLIGYASMIRVLAEEQLAGRLRISPRAVNSALRAAGASVPGMRVRLVDTIPAGAAGKWPLVVAWHAYRAGTGPAVPS